MATGIKQKNHKKFRFDLKKQGLASFRHGCLILLGVIFTLVLNVLLAQRLSAAHYGDYSLIIRNASFIALILTIGFDVSANRYLSNYIVAKRYHLARGFFSLTFQILAITSLIYIAFLFGLLVILYYLNFYHLFIFDNLTPVGWLWIAILIAFLQIGMVFLRTVNRADEGFFWGTVAQYAFLVIAVYFFIKANFTETHRYDLVLIFTGVSYALSGFAMAWIIKKTLYKKIKTSVRIKYRTKKWLRVSVSMMGYSVISLLLPALILNIVNLDPRIPEYDVGVFALTATVTSAFGLIPSMTVKGSVMAWMKPLFKTNQKKTLAKLIVFCNWAGIGFNVLMLIGCFLFGHMFVAHLPKAYAHLYPVLLIQMSAYIFDPSLNATRSVMMMMGKQNLVLLVRMITITCVCCFGILGAWLDGIVGASLGLLATQIIGAICDIQILHHLGFASLWVTKKYMPANLNQLLTLRK